MGTDVSYKEIRLPKLNGLSKVNLESTMIKIAEETGELAQYVGKFRGINGESIQKQEEEVIIGITQELLDVAQTAITMMFVLEEQYEVNIEEAVRTHILKLRKKGYINSQDI